MEAHVADLGVALPKFRLAAWREAGECVGGG
jgi:hypothetical protein